MRFPIYHEEANTLVNLKGEKSYFYNVTLNDLECERDLKSLSSVVTRSLIQLPEDESFRVMSFDDEVYVSSSSPDFSISCLRLSKMDNPLSMLGIDYLNEEINFFGDYFLLNGTYYSLLSVNEFPESLSLNQIQGMSDFYLNFKRLSADRSKSKLNFRRKIHFSNLFTGMKNIESEEAYKESENLLERITKGHEALFETELFFVVRGESKSDLDLNSERLIKDLKRLDFFLRVESHALTYFFMEMIPGVGSKFNRSSLMPASYLSALLPLHRDFVMGEGISFSSISSRRLLFDLFNKSSHNYNALITGQSGQGKSMLANKIIKEELARGTKAIILDLGGSFRKLTRFYDGEEFEGSFNPMQFKDPIFLKEFILAFIDRELDGREQGRLVKAISENLEVESFSGLIDCLDRQFEELSPYFEQYWEYFDCDKREVSNLLYVDFLNYPEKLKSPLIIFLIESFKQMNGKKIFLFDEAWGLLLKHADFVAESFRTFRKYNASAIAIGQNLEDFISTPLGRVIAQNCFYKFYFKQSIQSSEFADSFEVERISALESVKGSYSEFFLSYEGITKSLRFLPTSLEYELFTSDRNDNLLFDNYFNEVGRFIGFDRAITNFTKIKYGELHQ